MWYRFAKKCQYALASRAIFTTTEDCRQITGDGQNDAKFADFFIL